jgi:hypothetical protein
MFIKHPFITKIPNFLTCLESSLGVLVGILPVFCSLTKHNGDTAANLQQITVAHLISMAHIITEPPLLFSSLTCKPLMKDPMNH